MSVEAVEERRFEYSRTYRAVQVASLGILLLVDLFVCFVTGLSLVYVLTGWTPPSNIELPDTLLEIIVNLLALTLLNGLFILTFVQSVAVHVRGDGFRISTLFYTSEWLGWQEINSIRPHWFYDRILTVSVDKISPLYDLVGAFQLVGSRAFLIYKGGINGYEELIEILRQKRPDLFPFSRR